MHELPEVTELDKCCDVDKNYVKEIHDGRQICQYTRVSDFSMERFPEFLHSMHRDEKVELAKKIQKKLKDKRAEYFYHSAYNHKNYENYGLWRLAWVPWVRASYAGLKAGRLVADKDGSIAPAELLAEKDHKDTGDLKEFISPEDADRQVTSGRHG